MWTVKSESGTLHAALIQDTTRNFWENKLPFVGGESNLQYLPRCPHADYDAGGHDQWLKLGQFFEEEGVQVFEVTSILRKAIERASEAGRREIIKMFWGENPRAPSPAELKVEHITDGYPPTPYYDQANDQVILPDFKRATWTYTRDTSFTTQIGTVICNMRRYSRLLEPKVVKLAYESDPVLKKNVSLIWDANDLTIANTESPNIEGGDTEIIDEETIAVGLGQRSTFTGFLEFAKRIFSTDPNKQVKYVCAVFNADYPAVDYMHLDVVINFPANRKALIMPYYFESEIVKDMPPKKLLLKLLAATRAQSERDARPMHDVVGPAAFEKAGQCYVYVRGERNEPVLLRREVSLVDFLIKEDKIDKDGLIFVGGEPKEKNDMKHLMLALMEQTRGATNIVTVKSGTVISYARTTATLEALKQNGIRVKKWDDSYLDMLGGPHCSTAPLSRDPN
ncbi:MAG: arginine deiminase family protein [Candidatus Bathyarchaeia archaeon]|jgi:arginine deiminase